MIRQRNKMNIKHAIMLRSSKNENAWYQNKKLLVEKKSLTISIYHSREIGFPLFLLRLRWKMRELR